MYKYDPNSPIWTSDFPTKYNGFPMRGYVRMFFLCRSWPELPGYEASLKKLCYALTELVMFKMEIHRKKTNR